MTDTFTKHAEALHALFGNGFQNAMEQATPKDRNRILPFLHACYRRWYYATFIENIHFSPANMVDSFGHHTDMPPNTYLVPEAGQTPPKFTTVGFKTITYTMTEHPVVQDLALVAQYCTPYIDLNKAWGFKSPQARKVAQNLSIQDPYYASYLLDIANVMGIVAPMPGLFVQRMQVTEAAESILATPPEALFQQIVDAALQHVSVQVQNIFPIHIPLFSVDGLRDMLHNPLTIDEILDIAFGALGYDLEGIMNSCTLENLGEILEDSYITAEMMNNIFILGVMLDRLLFTPFGYFLRLIRPIYAKPFETEKEVGQYIDTTKGKDDKFAAFFVPCTSFTLTELGLDCFQAQPTEMNFVDGKELIRKEMLEAMLFTSPEGIQMFVREARAAIPVEEMPDSIYTFRVSPRDKPEVWLDIDIAKTDTLHNLYDEIVLDYFSDGFGGYRFYHGMEPNEFTHYPGGFTFETFRKPQLEKRKQKGATKHSHVQLMNLDFRHEENLLLIMGEPVPRTFRIKWLGESARNPRYDYPHLGDRSEESAAFLHECFREYSQTIQVLLDRLGENIFGEKIDPVE